MAFTLKPLPYPKDSLDPMMSARTLEHHHDKHHATYVTKLNDFVKGTKFENSSLEDIIRATANGTGTDKKIFNNAAQVWNHTFFWNCLTPKQGAPGKKLTDALVKAFGGVEDFKKQFTESAAGNFGSGWTWLVKKPDGSVDIVNTSNAGTPLTTEDKALLTCDVWEHAYYIDYRNARPDYLTAFIDNLINWDFVAENLRNV